VLIRKIARARTTVDTKADLFKSIISDSSSVEPVFFCDKVWCGKGISMSSSKRFYAPAPRATIV
jgi:hypothetical protein